MSVSKDVALEILAHPSDIFIAVGKAENGKFFLNIRIITEEGDRALLVSRYPCHETRDSVVKCIQVFLESCLGFEEGRSCREDRFFACLGQVWLNAIISQLQYSDKVETKYLPFV